MQLGVSSVIKIESAYTTKLTLACITVPEHRRRSFRCTSGRVVRLDDLLSLVSGPDLSVYMVHMLI